MRTRENPLFLCLLCLFRGTAARRIPPSASDEKGRRLDERETTGRRRILVPVPQSPDEHLVESLPLLEDGVLNVKHWAGHLPASSAGDKYFFYWLFEPEGDTSDKGEIPIIIWLNGGPGCSSMDGLWLENGPLRLTKGASGTFHISTDPYSWHKAPAYTLYIDQPVGTGLSFTTSSKYPRSDEEVNVDFYFFIQSFFKLHSDKFSNEHTRHPVYFSGESHAGHYIPHMMNYILKRNDDLQAGDMQIDLAGAAIGNGWSDPVHQYAAAKAAYGHGIIGHAQVLAMDEKEKTCQEKLQKGQYVVNQCFALLDDIIDASQGSSSNHKVSMYDVRKTEKKHSSREFPPGHHEVETYLGGVPLSSRRGQMPHDLYRQVLTAIHATAATDAGQEYRECTDPPYNALKHQDGKGVVKDIVEILEHKDNVRLLFFNGVEDLICNHVGNEAFLEVLPWQHKDSWMNAKRYAWRATNEEEGLVSGYMKEYGNLSFLKILNAGHMVPMDVPEVAFDMMRIFVSRGRFSWSGQELDRSSEGNDACPTCEICPTFPNTPASIPSRGQSEPVDSISGRDGRGHEGQIVISYSTAAAIGGLTAFVLLIVVFRNTKGQSMKRKRSTGYNECETEMATHYSDTPSDGMEAEYGEKVEVI